MEATPPCSSVWRPRPPVPLSVEATPPAVSCSRGPAPLCWSETGAPRDCPRGACGPEPRPLDDVKDVECVSTGQVGVQHRVVEASRASCGVRRKAKCFLCEACGDRRGVRGATVRPDGSPLVRVHFGNNVGFYFVRIVYFSTVCEAATGLSSGQDTTAHSSSVAVETRQWDNLRGAEPMHHHAFGQDQKQPAGGLLL